MYVGNPNILLDNFTFYIPCVLVLVGGGGHINNTTILGKLPSFSNFMFSFFFFQVFF
jgi:predicted alpha/beta hydrolase family esterase